MIARHLLNAGVEAQVFLLSRQKELAGAARTNFEVLLKMGAPILEALDRPALEDYRYQFERCDLVVDAILGTGLSSEVEGFFREAIELINGLKEENPAISVAAVDIPSGLNADTGQVMGAAVKADATITFGMIKAGQLSFPGAGLCGELTVIDISLPREFYEDVPYRLITEELAASLLPARPLDAHKGAVGHGLVLAGSPGKTGAAVMAAEACLRAGAGLCTLAGPAGLHPVLEMKTLEVMTEPLPETPAGTLGKASLARAKELMAGKTAVALGPGIGRGPELVALVKALLKEGETPLVIDADGLFAVADDLKMLAKAQRPLILTPHPGEMATLLGTDAKAVLADRLNLALNFAKDHQVVVVLKGANTLVAGPDGRAFVNLSGNPGMATGGSGDVLTGIILGLLCQGLPALEAAVLAVFAHGLAGDLAAEELGEAGLIAGDILDCVPEALMELEAPVASADHDE